MRETSIVISTRSRKERRSGRNAGEAYLPSHLLEVDELVFRYRGSLPSLGIDAATWLIVEPRKKAATGELVLARCGQNAFIGRWWAKHGLRSFQRPAEYRR